MKRTPTFAYYDSGDRTEYWVCHCRVPCWLFYLLTAAWPALRRGVESHRRWMFGRTKRGVA